MACLVWRSVYSFSVFFERSLAIKAYLNTWYYNANVFLFSKIIIHFTTQWFAKCSKFLFLQKCHRLDFLILHFYSVEVWMTRLTIFVVVWTTVIGLLAIIITETVRTVPAFAAFVHTRTRSSFCRRRHKTKSKTNKTVIAKVIHQAPHGIVHWPPVERSTLPPMFSFPFPPFPARSVWIFPKWEKEKFYSFDDF